MEKIIKIFLKGYKFEEKNDKKLLKKIKNFSPPILK